MKNNTVTIAKGIGILLMVLGHSGSPAIVQNFMYFFHMPFFFFASGFFLRAHQADYKSYVRRKIKNLWWPFVKYSFVFLLLHDIFYYLCLAEDFFSIKEIFLKSALIPFMFGNDNLLGGFWFLNELFYGTMFLTVLCYIFQKFTFFYDKLPLTSLIISIGVFFSLLTLSYMFPIKPIIFVTKMSSSLVSIALGFYASSLPYSNWKSECFTISKLLLSIFLLIIGAIVYPVSRTSVGSLHPVLGLYMIVMALIGIYMVFCVAHYINNGGAN